VARAIDNVRTSDFAKSEGISTVPLRAATYGVVVHHVT
jgi:hypothetical protein